MFHRPAIRVEPPRVDGNTVAYPFTCSASLRRYFRAFALTVAYDVDVSDVTPSLLTVPVVGNLVTIAWATGADLHVEALDAAFLRTLDVIRGVFAEWYPHLPFTTTIHVDEVVENVLGHAGTGLLYSGGIDSTCSLLKHRAKRPILIMMSGADPPWLVHQDWQLTEAEFWEQLQAMYRRFAAQEGVDIHFVATNMRDFLDEAQLNRDFGVYLRSGYWWGNIHHTSALLSLCAPLTVRRNIGTLLNASDAGAIVKEADANRPRICNAMAWADVKVVHDGYPLIKVEKIHQYMVPYVQATGRYPPIHVCWSQFDAPNCTTCHKCLRTILVLLLENIDPKRCGFPIDVDIVAQLRTHYETLFPTLNDTSIEFTRHIQNHIPEPFPHDLYNCRAFFEWFKHYTFPEHGSQKHPVIRYAHPHLRRYTPERIKQLVRKYIIKDEE
jgi:hypothetical protein